MCIIQVTLGLKGLFMKYFFWFQYIIMHTFIIFLQFIFFIHYLLITFLTSIQIQTGNICGPDMQYLWSCKSHSPPWNMLLETTLTSVACRLPRSTEFSIFEKGVFIGYHRNDHSLRRISSESNYTKSNLTYVFRIGM